MSKKEKFSQVAWKLIQPIYTKIIHSDFLQTLINGTLPKVKFCFYRKQDSYFLKHDILALSTASKAAPNKNQQHFFQTLTNSAVVEANEDNDYVLNKCPVKIRYCPQDNVTIQYIHFLQKSQKLTYPELLASMLPCDWIYAKLGKYITSQPHSKTYENWIKPLASSSYQLTVEKYINIVDEISLNVTGEVFESMLDILVQASIYELEFFIASYNPNITGCVSNIDLVN